METEISDLAKVGVSFLLSASNEEKLEPGEIATSFDKIVKDVRNFIELRSDIFLQKEEKIQQYQQDQLRKLEAEEEYYVNKCKANEISLSNCMKELREMEHSFFDLTKKVSQQEELNQKLKSEMSNISTEKDDLIERYHRTQSLYSMVIQWYENSLKIHVDIIKEDPMEIIFYFDSEKNKLAPYVKFEVIDNFNFKILDIHTELESDKENFQEFYTTRDVISFIYESKEKLKISS